MSVPLPIEPSVAPTQFSSAQSQPQSRRRDSSSKRVRRPAVTVVQALPKAKRPLWLKLLIGLQTLSTGLAMGTVGVTLAVYGLTVQADRRLNTTTATLRQLQHQEQQLTSAKAVLQYHLAQDAVDEQVEAPKKNVIFLDPEIAPTPSPAERATPETAPPPLPSSPMGY
ncbi:MAG: hypothetical protein O2890_08250 [Cyanobacteria bacterium]|nr:hypothetical protein [Cyanobacteriota bacterium]MDA0866397.1 hypothetical protein [Cyanobacteriota bacterium]